MSLAVIGSISLRMQHKQGQKQERVCGSRERRLPKVQESKVREDDDGCNAIDGLYHLPVVGCLSLIARFALKMETFTAVFQRRGCGLWYSGPVVEGELVGYLRIRLDGADGACGTAKV